MLDDYHAFKSTTGGSGGGGGGCGSGCFTWVLVGLAILWVIGKLFG